MLAQKASSIRESQGPGGLASRSLRTGSRSRRVPARSVDVTSKGTGSRCRPQVNEPPGLEEAAAWNELRPVLHEEVERLPEKYRLPVILSYLEGKTNEEVAALLEWPVGTVKGRLSRARDLLRSRLMRRGLCLSAAFVVTALGEGRVFAEVVPHELVKQTVRLAGRFGPRSAPPDPGSAEPPLSPEDDPSAPVESLSMAGRRRDARCSAREMGSAFAAYLFDVRGHRPGHLRRRRHRQRHQVSDHGAHSARLDGSGPGQLSLSSLAPENADGRNLGFSIVDHS